MSRQQWLEQLKLNDKVFYTEFKTKKSQETKIILILDYNFKLSNNDYVCKQDGENAHRSHFIQPADQN